MEFTEEQLASIQTMIDAKVQAATADRDDQITSLKTQNHQLIGEKRGKDEEARIAREKADEAERERLEASGSVEGYKSRLATFEEKAKTLAEELKVIKFDNAIVSAVGSRPIRPELREDLIDAIKFRAKYNDGDTNINGLSVDEYLDDLGKTPRGQVYFLPSGSTGGGAPGATSTAPTISLTKANFDSDKFYAMEKSTRNAWASQNDMAHLIEQ